MRLRLLCTERHNGIDIVKEGGEGALGYSVQNDTMG